MIAALATAPYFWLTMLALGTVAYLLARATEGFDYYADRPAPEQQATWEELRAETLRYALEHRERGRVSSDYTREGVEPWWGDAS
jgi:hypothetical protein